MSGAFSTDDGGRDDASRFPDPALEVRSDLPVDPSYVQAMRSALALSAGHGGAAPEEAPTDEAIDVTAATGVARGLGEREDIPVGALVLDADGAVIGRGINRRESDHDPTGHAEVVALRQAGIARGGWRLSGCTLVVTLEPCAMCAGAAIQARLDRIVFGAWDRKAGACGSVWDLPRDRLALHRPEVVGGVLEADCAAALRSFFAARR